MRGKLFEVDPLLKFIFASYIIIQKSMIYGFVWFVCLIFCLFVVVVFFVVVIFFYFVFNKTNAVFSAIVRKVYYIVHNCPYSLSRF